MPLPVRTRRAEPGQPLATALLGLGLLALVLVAADRLLGPPAPGSEPAGAPSADAPCPSAEAPCPDTEGDDRGGPDRSPVLTASDVCLPAGYLCAGLDEGREIRVVRWPDDTRRIRVRVPSPPGLDPAGARLLQEAAGRGVRAWHGRPFDIRVDLSDRPGRHDFVVRWGRLLGTRELGRTRTRWIRRNGASDLQVQEFSLATHDPNHPARELPSRQVELTAAHEMGHVLGLHHSDDPADVMYPENTATRLTSRDYTTLHALYQLENGAFIR